MQSKVADLIVILGTGGTIAGKAAQANDNVGYKAGEIGVEALIAGVPGLSTFRLEAQQVAQLDSKDMDFQTWRRLALAVEAQLTRDEVRGVLITHGTDTIEETAYFLHRVLAPRKPVVLTAAMRPATALQLDGPQNMLDAAHLVNDAAAAGVMVCVAGQVYAADQVQKAHSYRVDAFRGRDGTVLAQVEEGQVRWLSQALPGPLAIGTAALPTEGAAWPRIEIVLNHANADGRLVRLLVHEGVEGLVVAGTGNGTLSAALEQALLDAQAAGVQVLRSTRCDGGPVAENGRGLPSAGALSPVKARVELLLRLLGTPPQS
ncbi:asparaginase [Roseateles sp. DB2]|uniref:asparaginase n=1 Tax=Roseateles sp. DB2 TaxID=3453717 RepID=UPI003EE8A55B